MNESVLSGVVPAPPRPPRPPRVRVEVRRSRPSCRPRPRPRPRLSVRQRAWRALDDGDYSRAYQLFRLVMRAKPMARDAVGYAVAAHYSRRRATAIKALRAAVCIDVRSLNANHFDHGMVRTCRRMRRDYYWSRPRGYNRADAHFMAAVLGHIIGDDPEARWEVQAARREGDHHRSNRLLAREIGGHRTVARRDYGSRHAMVKK